MKLSMIHNKINEVFDSAPARIRGFENRRWWQSKAGPRTESDGTEIYPFEISSGDGNPIQYEFYCKYGPISDNKRMGLLLRRNGLGEWPDDLTVAQVGFYALQDGQKSYGITGTGNTGKVMATARAAIQLSVRKHDPDIVLFEAHGRHGGRTSIYSAMVRRFMPSNYTRIQTPISTSSFLLIKHDLLGQLGSVSP